MDEVFHIPYKFQYALINQATPLLVLWGSFDLLDYFSLKYRNNTNTIQYFIGDKDFTTRYEKDDLFTLNKKEVYSLIYQPFQQSFFLIFFIKIIKKFSFTQKKRQILQKKPNFTSL